MVSKKEKRKITVDGRVYWWQVHYDKDCVRPYLSISSDEKKLLLKQAYDQETGLTPGIIKVLIKRNRL